VTLALLIFLAVTLAVLVSGFIWFDLSRRDEKRAVQRLSEELQKPQAEQPGSSLFKNVNDFDLTEQKHSWEASDLGVAAVPGPGVGPPPRKRSLRDQLELARMHLTPQMFLVWSVSGALSLCVLGLFVQGWLLAVPAALVGAATPWFCLKRRLNARQDKLLGQLPAAFDLMARVMRAGLSLAQAFQGVADSFEEPLVSEFGRCREEQNLGISPEVSLHGLAERTGVVEMKIFVMALLIQRQIGGNLADILERLAGLIRERQRLRNHTRTLTAEGRLQALVLLIMPVVMFLVIRTINKAYTDLLLEHPLLLLTTGGLMAVGTLWISKIIDIE